VDICRIQALPHRGLCRIAAGKRRHQDGRQWLQDRRLHPEVGVERFSGEEL